MRTVFVFLYVLFFSCSNTDAPDPKPGAADSFIFGADLSVVNQVLDHGGVYKSDNVQKNPYAIMADHGTTLARFRLWHDPVWTTEVYGENGTQLYNDLGDVELSMERARQSGMKVLLDFHFSDTWADPGKQTVPAAWKNIESMDVLEDSVYNYTLRTLSYLGSKGLMPAFVQLGNETNCGMLFTDAGDEFPSTNVCEGNWVSFGRVVNAGIKAVRDAAKTASTEIKVILHVADPKNVDWFFSNLETAAEVTDYDIIGFSYYPLWHTTVPLAGISTQVSSFKTKFRKDVMILETAYPWTTESYDAYTNLLGSGALDGYPFTQQGQHDFLVSLTKEMRAGGGIGIIYWEPAWISSDMKDLWGSGSPWENATFFDFDGNPVKAIDYMKLAY